MFPYILAASVLALPQGHFEGKSVCTGPTGDRFEVKQALEINGDTMTTRVHNDGTEPEQVFVKTATAAAGSNGRFTWSGPAVVRGSGYCTLSQVCHWNLVVRDPNLGELVGEDTIFVADGMIRLIGSAGDAGTTYVCEETYALPPR